MIKLTFEDKKINLKNRFDEITLQEFDRIVNMISKNPGVSSLVDIIESFCEDEIDLREFTLGTYIEILENFLVEDVNQYPVLFKFDDKKIKIKDGQLDLTGKQVSQLEKIYKSDIEDKSSMIISVLFCGEFDEDFFKIIRKETSSKFIPLINLINPIQINLG